MCTCDSSTLLYEDTFKNPSVVRWLDCSTSPPKLCTDSNPIHTEQYFLRDICFAEGEEKVLLITSSYTNRMDVYDSSTGKLEWSVKGQLNENEEKEIHPNGVATDGRDHLFVCDSNNKCIQMFSTDGKYMGVLIKQGQQALGEPHRIHWCKSTSSLVVAHAKKKYNHISVMRVQ